MFHFKNSEIVDLFQWNTNVVLVFDSIYINEEVHFSNDRTTSWSRVINENGEVAIPDFLLQEPLPIEVYLFIIDENSRYTKKRQILRVVGRPKPENYVISEEEEKIWNTKLDIYQGEEKAGNILAVDQQGNITTSSLLDKIKKSDDNGEILVDGTAIEIYKLPIASEDLLGGIRVGEGLLIDPETGILSVANSGDVAWDSILNKPNFSDVATSGDYDDLLNKPTIPASLSELENDTDFVSDPNYIHTDNNYSAADKEKLDGVQEGAQVNVNSDWLETDSNSDAFILNKPTKLSDFSNDTEFISNTVENLINYYTKTEINDIVGTMSKLKIEIVTELPEPAEASSTTIYLKLKEKSWLDNSYDEFLYMSSSQSFEKIGDTTIDLTNYLQKDGDGSNVIVNFSASEEGSLPSSGQTLANIIGSLIGHLGALNDVAFSGSYDDLSNTPFIDSIDDGEGNVTLFLNKELNPINA